MKRRSPTLILVILLPLIISGMALIIISWIDILPSLLHPKGIRASGFCLLLVGIGELLNHPLQKKLSVTSDDDTVTEATYERRRNPCGLGNLFDILGLISLFIACSFFFFSASS